MTYSKHGQRFASCTCIPDITYYRALRELAGARERCILVRSPRVCKWPCCKRPSNKTKY